jgi:hypothetical protein
MDWLRGHRRGSFSTTCFGFGRGINPFSKIYVWLVFCLQYCEFFVLTSEVRAAGTATA